MLYTLRSQRNKTIFKLCSLQIVFLVVFFCHSHHNYFYPWLKCVEPPSEDTKKRFDIKIMALNNKYFCPAPITTGVMKGTKAAPGSMQICVTLDWICISLNVTLIFTPGGGQVSRGTTIKSHLFVCHWEVNVSSASSLLVLSDMKSLADYLSQLYVI